MKTLGWVPLRWVLLLIFGISAGLLNLRVPSVTVANVLRGFSTVTVGAEHTCATTLDDIAQCWGRNLSGELGDGDSKAEKHFPTNVLGVGSGIAAVSAGGLHACALTASGGVKCWGANDWGQLGDGHPLIGGEVQDTAVNVVGLQSGVVQISAGALHTCAVMTNGTVKCWGLNHSGQLGSQTTETCGEFANEPCSSVPKDVVGLAGPVSKVSAGGDDSRASHTCAVLTSGGVRCWGNNNFGQLGNGSTGLPTATPQNVTGLGSGVADVGTGRHHSCALMTNGGVKCWGFNEGGQLGNGSYGATSMSATPVDVSGLTSGVAGVAAGGGVHTCALTTAGGVKCWGWNGWGQVGVPIGAITDIYTTPVDVTGLSTGVSAVAAGAAHSCAVTGDGVVRCWGWNSHGQLGDGGTTDSGTPVDMDFDRDGCTDAQELGPDQTQGGLRNPKNFWDFFDTPDTSNLRDKIIDISDIFRVNQRFGSTGDPTIDPLSPPPPAPAYHPAFDRTTLGPNAWNLGPPDGLIDIGDILRVNNQFGHSCM